MIWHIYKNKKLKSIADLSLLHSLGEELVELQGIEPWSREDERVRSTCLVDFNCREQQGHQHPDSFRSCCCLNIAAQHNEAQFTLSTPHIHTRRTEVWAMMASADLISG
jgi:hypothetical protein